MKNMHVLVVDDEPGIRDLLSDTLAGYGHQVTCAENGVEAIARLAGLGIDIVFLDIRMPKGDGLTALKDIHALWPALPVVVITGGGTPETLNEAFRLGATACMTKPFSLTAVTDMLETFGPELEDAA